MSEKHRTEADEHFIFATIQEAHDTVPEGALRDKLMRAWVLMMRRPLPEQEANARLMAAAPDLLAALRGFNLEADRLVGAQGPDVILRLPMAAFQAAAAAIAKVESGTP